MPDFGSPVRDFRTGSPTAGLTISVVGVGGDPLPLRAALSDADYALRMAGVGAVEGILSEVLPLPVQREAWLGRELAELEGRTPIQAIVDGDADAVSALAASLAQSILETRTRDLRCLRCGAEPHTGGCHL